MPDSECAWGFSNAVSHYQPCFSWHTDMQRWMRRIYLSFWMMARGREATILTGRAPLSILQHWVAVCTHLESGWLIEYTVLCKMERNFPFSTWNWKFWLNIVCIDPLTLSHGMDSFYLVMWYLWVCVQNHSNFVAFVFLSSPASC